MILPQTNATLTSVAGGGATEDFDAPAGGGTAKWTGRAGVYLRERSARVEDPAGSSVVVTRSLVVPADLPVTWAQGDTVTLERAGGPATVAVRDIERHEAAGIEQRTIRLVLEDA